MSDQSNLSRLRRKAQLFIDPISPYAYFYLHQLHRLDPLLDIELRPILFGALLAHWGQLGPAEIASKRKHTYQHCVWLASRLGLQAGGMRPGIAHMGGHSLHIGNGA
ncbi:MAG: hypothetical protein EBW47_09690, partial [Betaproteobacteria bacterium]|nr:hypothetical protein [Betaproteobacteria bacterium]